MPKHALDRATIAELILSQLSPDAGAQLFLLNFERLVLRDFSRYETHRGFGGKPSGARISEEYLTIIEDLMKGELPAGQPQRLISVLSSLNEAPPIKAGELASAGSEVVRSLFRFFPQNCFAYIGGAFFEAFLKGRAHVQGFDRDREVYHGKVSELNILYSPDSPRYSELPYTKECGRFVNWLNDPYVRAEEWLYVAPVICDGSFYGLLYRFSNAESKTIAGELRAALREAETLFRDMRYALIADVAERIGRLEDPLNAFLAELPNYQNVALAMAWPEVGEPKVYARSFARGEEADGLYPPERRLVWEEIPAAHIYSREEQSSRARELSELSSKCADSWVDVTKDDKQVESISLSRGGVRRLFRREVLRRYKEAGLSLCYGVVLPGKFIRHDYSGRHLELYFFEPVEANIKRCKKRFTQGIRRKLYGLIPLLQEIAILESSAEEQARKLNQIIASLVFHEVKNSLRRRTGPADGSAGGGVPVWLHEHVNRCLEAYGDLEKRPCTRGDWGEVAVWLQSYWSHYIERPVKVSDWPNGLAPIKVSKELIYVIACELIKNAVTAKAQHVEVSLKHGHAPTAALSVLNDGHINFDRLKENLNEYWESALTARSRNGLALIMQLLRVLHAPHSSPIDADMAGSMVRITCSLVLA